MKPALILWQQSFVRTAEDVGEMRRFLEEHGGRRIKIISKIENAEGVENIDEILRVSERCPW